MFLDRIIWGLSVMNCHNRHMKNEAMEREAAHFGQMAINNINRMRIDPIYQYELAEKAVRFARFAAHAARRAMGECGGANAASVAVA